MGDNSQGQLGDGSRKARVRPVRILDGGVADIAAGSAHSLFVMSSGEVRASGLNFNGQLGDGTNLSCVTDCSFQRSKPVSLKMPHIGSASARGNHTLLLREDSGFAFAAGANDMGQLGVPFWGSASWLTQLALPSLKSMSAGARHNVFVAKDGTAFTAGSNTHGQLGFETSMAWPTGCIAAWSAECSGRWCTHCILE